MKVLETTQLRNSGTVKNRVRDLIDAKLVFGDTKKGYKLTTVGFNDAVAIIARLRP